MKPVAFFRGGWRKKASKSPPPSPSSPSSTTSVYSSSAATYSTASMVHMQTPSETGSLWFPRAPIHVDARSELYYLQDKNKFATMPYRQRTKSASVIGSGFDTEHCVAPPVPSKPRRPRRPPPLDLSSETSRNLEDSKDSDVTPRAPFTAPLVLKKKASAHTHALRPVRTDAELDGVWHGFLAELEEDFDFLDTAEPRKGGTSHRRCFSRRYNDFHSHLMDSEDSRPHTSPKFDELSQLYSPPSYHPTFSRSMSNLSNSSKDPTRWNHHRQPKRVIAEDPLSLFPAPPPLNIRRGRTAPTPLILNPTPSIVQLPLSPAMSTPDTTPVATPTTPKFCQSPATRDGSTFPVSILKKRSLTSNQKTEPLSPSPSSNSFVYASSSASISGFPSSTHIQLPPARPLRPTQSASHIRVKNPATHKATFSDSQAMDTTHAGSQLSYLQSMGRARPARTPIRSLPEGQAV
ncbi:hypothetical protein BDN71DRAFT_380916 [Pleurotus eryngii]|uniref:Uncharacterized protein n=1 Tax=Pleurotus eryngii TaxID=5323 RepID=A0A9P6A3W8_PLEER|nr:hypothetical protein BDN71DRAFT_380916 [Pleurotus eryngii]